MLIYISNISVMNAALKLRGFYVNSIDAFILSVGIYYVLVTSSSLLGWEYCNFHPLMEK